MNIDSILDAIERVGHSMVAPTICFAYLGLVILLACGA